MKEISYDLLKQCANNLMFDMKDEEYKTLLNEFGTLIEQMKLIDNIDGLASLEPMTFPFDCTTSYLREDEESEPMLPLNEVLRNAKDVTANQIKLPKVVK